MAQQPLQLNISGMTCMHCAKAVSRSIMEVPGTSSVNVVLDKGTAELVYDNTLTTPASITEHINQNGPYRATRP